MGKANGRSWKMFNIATNMMDTINMIRKMAMEYFNGKVVTFTKVIISTMNDMVMV